MVFPQPGGRRICWIGGNPSLWLSLKAFPCPLYAAGPQIRPASLGASCPPAARAYSCRPKKIHAAYLSFAVIYLIVNYTMASGTVKAFEKVVKNHFSSFFIRCLRLLRGQHRMQESLAAQALFADLPHTPRAFSCPYGAIYLCRQIRIKSPLTTPRLNVSMASSMALRAVLTSPLAMRAM